ncbi:MAG: hypothetical protein LBI35_02610 [Burkholderiales bacterium]|jgi:hypothetical protein|nr:hypothetical protein [Burkholderiales bacterium]
MIVDGLLVLHGEIVDGKPVFKEAGSTFTNAIDLSQRRDVGAGENLYFRVFTEPGASVNVQLGVADDTEGTGFEGLVSAASSSAKPAVQRIPPKIGSTGKRYLVAMVLDASGKWFADIGLELPSDMKAYPSGFEV